MGPWFWHYCKKSSILLWYCFYFQSIDFCIFKDRFFDLKCFLFDWFMFLICEIHPFWIHRVSVWYGIGKPSDLLRQLTHTMIKSILSPKFLHNTFTVNCFCFNLNTSCIFEVEAGLWRRRVIENEFPVVMINQFVLVSEIPWMNLIGFTSTN